MGRLARGEGKRMTKIVSEFELYGKSYRFETGELAKQATGAVLVTCGETSVLVTAVVSKQQRDYDFFPLTVDFMEKMYAVGRIPGGYLKREAKPSDHGTLTARMIDRPIRPGFPDGFKNEVHVVATTLVNDGQNPPDAICVGGASAARPPASASAAIAKQGSSSSIPLSLSKRPLIWSSPSLVPRITSPW